MRVSEQEKQKLIRWMQLPYETYGTINVDAAGWVHFKRSSHSSLQPNRTRITFHTHVGPNDYAPPSRDDLRLLSQHRGATHVVVSPGHLYVFSVPPSVGSIEPLLDAVTRLQVRFRRGDAYNRAYLSACRKHGVIIHTHSL